jgi:hypothetical protein
VPPQTPTGSLELTALIQRVGPCDTGQTLLANLDKPEYSGPPPAQVHSPPAASPTSLAAGQTCCLHCHEPARPLHLPHESLARLNESCLACHQAPVDTTF